MYGSQVSANQVQSVRVNDITEHHILLTLSKGSRSVQMGGE